MKKISIKQIFPIITYILLFLIFLLLSMNTIRHILDSQVPNLDKLIEIGKNQIFNLKILGITLQYETFSIYNNGEFVISYKNNLSFYLLPIVIALICTIISILFVKKIKKYTSKWKL